MSLQQEVKTRRNYKQSGQSLLRRAGKLFSPVHNHTRHYNCRLSATVHRREAVFTPYWQIHRASGDRPQLS